MGRKPGVETPPAIAVRGTREWIAWVQGFARGRYRCNAATLIDLALAKLAEADGFDRPPARLVPTPRPPSEGD